MFSLHWLQHIVDMCTILEYLFRYDWQSYPVVWKKLQQRVLQWEWWKKKRNKKLNDGTIFFGFHNKKDFSWDFMYLFNTFLFFIYYFFLTDFHRASTLLALSLVNKPTFKLSNESTPTVCLGYWQLLIVTGLFHIYSMCIFIRSFGFQT